MDEQIAFNYLADKNPDGRTVSGTPLRDLTAADVAGYPAWQVREIAACGFYQAVEKKRPSATKVKESAPATSTATSGRRSATGDDKDSKKE